jgi:hypothetical protein
LKHHLELVTGKVAVLDEDEVNHGAANVSQGYYTNAPRSIPWLCALHLYGVAENHRRMRDAV